jgi:hypothetical protein
MQYNPLEKKNNKSIPKKGKENLPFSRPLIKYPTVYVNNQGNFKMNAYCKQKKNSNINLPVLNMKSVVFQGEKESSRNNSSKQEKGGAKKYPSYHKQSQEKLVRKTSQSKDRLENIENKDNKSNMSYTYTHTSENLEKNNNENTNIINVVTDVYDEETLGNLGNEKRLTEQSEKNLEEESGKIIFSSGLVSTNSNMLGKLIYNIFN